jgi:hypothetical protein
MRTTLDLSNEAYQLAKAIAREQNRSMGSVVSALIIAAQEPDKGNKATITLENGFPTFRCIRKVSSAEVAALDEEA